MRYKVDVDITKNRTWAKYARWLRYSLLRLKEGGVIFDSCSVYRTRHGYHLYFSNEIKINDLNYANLIECLLGSDMNKQLFFFAEGDDILFIKKRRYTQKLDERKTAQINAMIKKANKWNGYKKIELRL